MTNRAMDPIQELRLNLEINVVYLSTRSRKDKLIAEIILQENGAMKMRWSWRLVSSREKTKYQMKSFFRKLVLSNFVTREGGGQTQLWYDRVEIIKVMITDRINAQFKLDLSMRLLSETRYQVRKNIYLRLLHVPLEFKTLKGWTQISKPWFGYYTTDLKFSPQIFLSGFGTRKPSLSLRYLLSATEPFTTHRSGDRRASRDRVTQVWWSPGVCEWF
jgi:hypothetical protein